MRRRQLGCINDVGDVTAAIKSEDFWLLACQGLLYTTHTPDTSLLYVSRRINQQYIDCPKSQEPYHQLIPTD